jgi:hypothetical protein
MFNVQGLQFVTNKGRISTRWGCCDGDAALHQKIKDIDGLASFYALSGFQGQVLKTQGKELWVMSLTVSLEHCLRHIPFSLRSAICKFVLDNLFTFSPK